MLTSVLPQVSLRIDKPTRLTFLIYDLPMISYREKIYERFGWLIATTLSNIAICTKTYVSIERLESTHSPNGPDPFTEEEIATAIAAMLCAFKIPTSLPGVDCEIVRPLVYNRSAEDILQNKKEDDAIYSLIQPKLDVLWYISP